MTEIRGPRTEIRGPRTDKLDDRDPRTEDRQARGPRTEIRQVLRSDMLGRIIAIKKGIRFSTYPFKNFIIY